MLDALPLGCYFLLPLHNHDLCLGDMRLHQFILPPYEVELCLDVPAIPETGPIIFQLLRFVPAVERALGASPHLLVMLLGYRDIVLTEWLQLHILILALRVSNLLLPVRGPRVGDWDARPVHELRSRNVVRRGNSAIFIIIVHRVVLDIELVAYVRK